MKRNKFIAAIIAILGGSIGAQRFYLGDIRGGINILVLLFISTMIFNAPIIPVMIGIFEFFKFMTMGQSEFDRRHNKHLVPHARQGRRSAQNRARESYAKAPTKRENPYKKTGIKKYDEFDTEGAIRDFEKSLEIDPNDKDIYVYLARAYSLLEKPEESIQALQKAMALGYKQMDQIETHEDLAFLRISPQYQAFKSNGYKLAPSSRLEAPKSDLLDDDLLLSQLKRLSELRQRGLLSETDFKIEKKKLLQRR